MSLPSSWSEVFARLAATLGNDREAEEWVRAAVLVRFGVESLHDLDRVGRLVAFQKTVGAALLLEELGIPAELEEPDGSPTRWLLYRDGTLESTVESGYEGRRGRVARAFARYFDGNFPEGPPWRLGTNENDRPTYDEWASSADFGEEGQTVPGNEKEER